MKGSFKAIGSGTTGSINCMSYDSYDQRMYVGGKFKKFNNI